MPARREMLSCKEVVGNVPRGTLPPPVILCLDVIPYSLQGYREKVKVKEMWAVRRYRYLS
jgi:hypothetical protein